MMKATEILNKRIAQANTKRLNTFNHDLSYDEVEMLINPKLEALCREKSISQRIWVDQVFGGRKKPYKRDFILKVLEKDREVKSFEEILKAADVDHPIWDQCNWLLSAHNRSSTILAIKRDRDNDFAGFATFEVNLTLENHADEEEEPDPTLYLNVWLDTVYMLPSKRGRGFSEALSYAISEYVDDIAHAVVEWEDPARKYLERYPLTVAISGEAHTAGGARYLTRTVENIRSRIQCFESDSSWEVIPGVENYCDCSDFNNGGFTRR